MNIIPSEPMIISLQVEVLLKRIYGKERFYPYNEFAKTLCKVLGTPTITKEQLLIMREDGWNVVVRVEEYKLE